MRVSGKRLRTLIPLMFAFGLVAAACGGGDDSGETPTTQADGGTTTTTQPGGGGGGIEFVSLTARCRAKPPNEDGRCNNLLRAIPAANAALEAAGDNRRLGLTIISDNEDWGDYKTEFVLASEAGEAPDIQMSGHEDIGAWATSGIIVDLTDMLGNFPEFDDVIESLWASTELNDRRWAVPQDSEARPMYYRKDLLAQLGWSQGEIDGLPAAVASGGFTMEDMLDTAAEAVDKGVVDSGKGWSHRPENGPDFLMFYYAAGGEIIAPGQEALIFNKDAALKLYKVFAEARSRDIVVSTRLDGDWLSFHGDVALGNVLFWFGGSWQWAEWAVEWVADLGGEDYLSERVGFSAVPGLAAGTGQPVTLTHPLVYMVSSRSEHPDLALLVISKETTKELNTEYALASGKLAILESQATYEPYMSARLASEMLPITEFATFLPNSPFFSRWSEAYYLGIQAVELGELTPAEAVGVVVSELENELADKVIIN